MSGQVLLDLSTRTVQMHKNVISITKALRNHNIAYWWKHPATLKITPDSSTSIINTIPEGSYRNGKYSQKTYQINSHLTRPLDLPGMEQSYPQEPQQEKVFSGKPYLIHIMPMAIPPQMYYLPFLASELY